MNNFPVVIPPYYGQPRNFHPVPHYGGLGENLGTAGKIILYPSIGTIIGIGMAIPTAIILEKVLDKAKSKDPKLKSIPFYAMIAMPVIGGLLGGVAGVFGSLVNK
jgi:hypothetical protein